MSTKRSFKSLALDQLDESLKAFGPAAATQRPPAGWARAIREALGMSAGQLARRVGVSRETIATLERSEGRGTITLASLEKLARVSHSMRLEAQGLAPERERRQIERHAEALLAGSPRRLWE
jgi:transcriptional regulator with XRE-family HTH domain